MSGAMNKKEILEDYRCEDILHKKQFEMQFIIRFDLVIDYNFYSPFHWHNHIELIYVIDGSMDLFVEGMETVLSAGQLAIVNSEEIHSTRLRGKVKYLLLQVPLSAFNGIDSSMASYIFGTIFEGKAAEAVGKRLLAMKKILDEDSPGCRIKFVSLLYELFYFMISKYRLHDEKLKSVDFSHGGIRRISPVISFLEKNYRRRIQLEEIASSINVSEEHLCRIFRQYTGMTVNSYLMSLRIASVYSELRNTDKKIAVILEENGVRDYKGFMRDFRKTFNCTPQDIRKNSL